MCSSKLQVAGRQVVITQGGSRNSKTIRLLRLGMMDEREVWEVVRSGVVPDLKLNVFDR